MEISYVLYARTHLRVLMTQKLRAVGMRNAKLGNHLKSRLFWIAAILAKTFQWLELNSQIAKNQEPLQQINYKSILHPHLEMTKRQP